MDRFGNVLRLRFSYGRGSGTSHATLSILQERKIGTRLLFAGNITKQPAYINSSISTNQEFPIADQIMNNAFWLGVYPGLNFEMLDFIVTETKNFLKDT